MNFHNGANRLTFETRHGQEDCKSLAAEWDNLLRTSSCNEIFSSCTWFLCAQILNASRTPVVHVARRGGVLAGVLPLWWDESMKAALSPEGLTEYFDIIVPRGDIQTAIDLLDYAVSAGSYRRIGFANVRPDAALVSALQSHWTRQLQIEPLSPCFFIPLPPSYSDFLAAHSRKFRQNLRYAKRRAAAAGIEVRMMNAETFPPNRVAEEFIRLHLARFGADSVFEESEPQEFLARTLPVFFVTGGLQVCGLFVKSTMVGVNLFIATPGSLGDWNAGYLPEFDHCSPGRLMIDAGIEHAYRLGIPEYDFLRGDEDYKMSWTSNSRELRRYVLLL